MEHASHNSLMLKRMGVDTHQEPVVYMRSDCHVCRSEGFSAQSRVRVTTDRASVIATLRGMILNIGEKRAKNDPASLTHGRRDSRPILVNPLGETGYFDAFGRYRRLSFHGRSKTEEGN